MNCKQGDLAYIVVPQPYHRTLHGKFVDVGVNGHCDIGTIGVDSPMFGKAWLCRFHVPWLDGARTIRQCWLYDSWLRPIRPTDGEDETLQWAGKPNEVTA